MHSVSGARASIGVDFTTKTSQLRSSSTRSAVLPINSNSKVRLDTAPITTKLARSAREFGQGVGNYEPAHESGLAHASPTRPSSQVPQISDRIRLRAFPAGNLLTEKEYSL